MSMMISGIRGKKMGWPLTRAAGVLGLLLLAGCGKDGGTAEAAPSPVRLGPTDVTIAVLQEIRSGPAVSGTLKAENEAQVRAQAAGAVTAVYAETGQPVDEGQLLARIEATTAEQALLSAQQMVRSAGQAYEVAQRQAERTSTLVSAGALAESNLESARSAATAAQAQLANARAQLSAAQKQVANTEVRAPISGIVSARPVNAGDVVQLGAELFTVVSPAGMKLEASVPSEQLGQVHVGAPVEFTVSGYPGRTFEGRVDRISPAADPTTRQVPIFVTIPNPGRALVSGLFAQGKVASKSENSVVVPQTAVDETGPVPTVIRLRGGKAEQVTVELGARDTQHETVAINSGLGAGDTIVVSTARGVLPGTPVQVTGVAAKR
jgi:RND family efflux transporter MFP subunit